VRAAEKNAHLGPNAWNHEDHSPNGGRAHLKYRCHSPGGIYRNPYVSSTFETTDPLAGGLAVADRVVQAVPADLKRLILNLLT
jgi:hypothetical protein